MKNLSRNKKLIFGGIILLVVLIIVGMIFWLPKSTPNTSKKEAPKDNSFKYTNSAEATKVTEIPPLEDKCKELKGEKKEECLEGKELEEYILSGDHEECLDLEDDERRNKCLFKVIENREGKSSNTEEDLEELKDLCKLITNKEKEVACLEQLAMFSSYKFEKNICQETFSAEVDPFNLKKCRDRQYALEIEDRVKDATSTEQKRELIERCTAEEDPLAEEYAILCRDYGLRAIDYNCEILSGELKDWCETEKIYKNNKIMTIEDCQEIPVERERKVCTREIETQTKRSELDSDNDGVSDAKELFYNTDPFQADTNGDGLTDGEELGGKFFEGETTGTNPLQKDTDGDGYTDYEEVKEYGTDPLNPQDHPE